MEAWLVFVLLIAAAVTVWVVLKQNKPSSSSPVRGPEEHTLASVNRSLTPEPAPTDWGQLDRDERAERKQARQDAVDDKFDEWLRGMAARMSDEYFHSSVAGVTYDNEDGSSRQALIKAAKPMDTLSLRPDPANEHDKHAVKVLNSAGQQLGWLPREQAREVFTGSMAGEIWMAVVRSRAIAEGTRKWGMRIVLLKMNERVTAEIRAEIAEENGME